MQIFFPKEEANEIRATILPEVAKKFIDLGIEVSIETGLGDNVFVSDTLYEEVGASICTNKSDGFISGLFESLVSSSNLSFINNS